MTSLYAALCTTASIRSATNSTWTTESSDSVSLRSQPKERKALIHGLFRCLLLPAFYIVLRQDNSVFMFLNSDEPRVCFSSICLNSSWWVWALLLLLLNIKQLVMVNHYYEQRRLLRLRLHLRLRLCPHCVARSRTSGHMSVRFIWNKEKETNLMFYSFFSRKSQPKK